MNHRLHIPLKDLNMQINALVEFNILIKHRLTEWSGQ